jgi:hypothetical protein
VTEPAEEAPRPVLRVVRGNPDPAELAALVAVVTAAASSSSDEPARVRSSWAAHERLLRGPLTRGGWRTSFAPR